MLWLASGRSHLLSFRLLCRSYRGGGSQHRFASTDAAEAAISDDDRRSNLKNVKNIIAVHSCKGGVGKSTVATNLACMLDQLGCGEVGLFDADIFGPSLPSMFVQPDETTKQRSWHVTQSEDKKVINPIMFHNIKCMSYGFVSPGTGGRTEAVTKASVIRGPVATQITQQLLLSTDWGELDYLIIDLPPGTGDIHITTCQELKVDAAVIITTPQNLSFVDVVKGIEMFQLLKVPTIAIVENMSYFRGDDDKVYHPFGKGHVSKLIDMYNFRNNFSLPIDPLASESGDSGIPYLFTCELPDVTLTYQQLANCVVKELKICKEIKPILQYSEKRGGIVVRLFDTEQAREYVIPSIEFRTRLNKIDKMLKLKPVDSTVYPLKINPRGNYAVNIEWSDSHDASIYTYEDIKALCIEYYNENGK